MASVMELLESLTNKEIRAKCIEYELPNIPVTDTSRKVIIKRLHEAMTGQPTMLIKKKTPKKRQTMHAITTATNMDDEQQYTIPITAKKSSPKARNRNTLAATTSTYASPEKLSYWRRSEIDGGITLNDSYDNAHAYENNSYDYNRNNSTTGSIASNNDSRSRRSVSLTKSGVLTTSYSTETVPLNKHDEYEEEDDEVESAEDDEHEQYTYTPPKTITSTHNKSKEFPFDYKYGTTQIQSHATENTYEKRGGYDYKDTDYPLSTNNNYAFPEQTQYSYTASDVQKTLPKLRQTNLGNLNIGGNSFSNSDNMPSTSRNLYPFEMLNSTAHAVSAEEHTAKPYMRTNLTATAKPRASKPYEDALKRTLYITPAAAPSSIHKRVSYAAPEDCEDEDDDNDAADAGEEHTNQFASNFARNLRNTSSPLQTNDYRPAARRSILKQHSDDVSVMKHLHDFVIALDRKYHLMRYFSITAFVLIVIFIIVLLLP